MVQKESRRNNQAKLCHVTKQDIISKFNLTWFEKYFGNGKLYQSMMVGAKLYQEFMSEEEGFVFDGTRTWEIKVSKHGNFVEIIYPFIHIK